MILSFDIGEKNMAFALLDPATLMLKDWEVFAVRDTGSTVSKWKKQEDNMSGLAACMMARKDRFPSTTVVLVESQHKNSPRMKMLEGAVRFFFHCFSPSVRCISYMARHKLGSVPGWLKGAKAKSMRKKIAITRCQEFITKTTPQEQWALDLFEDTRKQDDLSDCLLQALSYTGKNPTTATPAEDCLGKVMARKPTKKQQRTGLSVSNLLWMLSQCSGDTAETIKKWPSWQKHAEKIFGSVAKCQEVLALSAASLPGDGGKIIAAPKVAREPTQRHIDTGTVTKSGLLWLFSQAPESQREGVFWKSVPKCNLALTAKKHYGSVQAAITAMAHVLSQRSSTTHPQKKTRPQNSLSLSQLDSAATVAGPGP